MLDRLSKKLLLPIGNISVAPVLLDAYYSRSGIIGERPPMTKASIPIGNHQIRSARDLGGLVRQARKSIKMTQATLAGLCGCGTRFISELESGKPSVEFDLAVRVAEAVGIRLYTD